MRSDMADLLLLSTQKSMLISGDKAGLSQAFLSGDKGFPRYLLGRNEHAKALASLVKIDGIIDDFFSGKNWNDLPIIKGEDVPKDAIVVNCSMSISPLSASRRLESIGLDKCLNYSDLLRTFCNLVAVPEFVRDMRNDYAAYPEKWKALPSLFADPESRSVFDDVVSYRLTADPNLMSKYSVRFSDQYFEEFLHLSEEVFIDAGGYNGDTSEEFCKRYSDYRKVILFEPSLPNMLEAKKRLAPYRDIEFFNQGISDASGFLWFNPDAGSACAVSDSGSCRIDVTTLDNAIPGCISFIKMDLEGWELKALNGARRHIRENHPKLAISVYHTAADFWRVPEFILSIREDYDIYLRHYTEGWSETVMFFVPVVKND